MSDDGMPSEEWMRARIAELKAKLSAMPGGYVGGESPDLPLDMELAFLEHVYMLECEPTTTHARQLIEYGVSLPPPDSLSPAELEAKIAEVLRSLAEMGVFVIHTNHLTDFELYDQLWREILNEETWDISGMPDGRITLDLVSSGSEEDTELWLKYYASEEDRDQWLADFPDIVLPEQAIPPSDRDEILPLDWGLGDTF